MREIVSDAFYEFTKQYDMDREHHLVGAGTGPWQKE
jgi:hypothetical protein